MPNGKPNILVIWGDDIGITSRRSRLTVTATHLPDTPNAAGHDEPHRRRSAGRPPG